MSVNGSNAGRKPSKPFLVYLARIRELGWRGVRFEWDGSLPDNDPRSWFAATSPVESSPSYAFGRNGEEALRALLAKCESLRQAAEPADPK